ncbi:MAG: tRNA uridine-5-carboxymethylaminomethyl(34) synthesis enzyme MnmG [Victivallales bacterium]|jgi:tRNA uridine 5-carboxymethylaminomethyl modification enzyme|nr:tRNA uridine-5-carboxymethylaminomethyl(34) synthesis enzyme MnmG [Victivallales bacterium]
MKDYDVIVIGAGHAGCEAAYAAARIGANVLLITLNMDHIAQMSCNPAVGGVAKGQLVREIDALGGAQGVMTDAASIQFRMLNRTKGQAVWSPRSQCDKVIYQRGMKLLLEETPNLDILQSEVTEFLVQNGIIIGVENQFGDQICGRAVVVTTGTFLNGKLHYGMKNFPGGRAGDFPSNALSHALSDTLGLRLGRLKTGTPPRILAKTIDFSAMRLQEAENQEEEFSFWSDTLRPPLPQATRRNMPCYMVYSTEKTAEVVRENLQYSPMYQGVIKGIGARYCPSFEDKVTRFPQHPLHLLYLEPEGANTREYYINGISTSLPVEVQRGMVHSIPGMENATISRYAYAIEYDFLYPDQLERSLRVKSYPNLFCAGQINGTSGYEEAAGQGLAAGLNAARFAAGKSLIEFGRDQSYLGVMIDDLCTKEIVEPYRLFTSRAEYRLHLRQDNADLRLSELAHDLGLLPEDKYREFTVYKNELSRVLTHCQSAKFHGKCLLIHLKELPGEIELETARSTLPFPAELLPELPDNRLGRRIWRELLIEARYDGYLQREIAEIDRMKKFESLTIPADFNYDMIKGLGTEARIKLAKVRPSSIAQAGRIDGITPADVALLQVALLRTKHESATTK